MAGNIQGMSAEPTTNKKTLKKGRMTRNCFASPTCFGSVALSEDVVGLVAVSPVSARTVSSPTPESPPEEPEDCEYPEEPKESEWEEAETVWIVAHRSEEDPAKRSDSRDYGDES